MAAVGRAFTAHAAAPATPRGRRVVAPRRSPKPLSRRRRDRPVRVFLVGRPPAPHFGEVNLADLADLADTAPTADATEATERAGE